LLRPRNCLSEIIHARHLTRTHGPQALDIPCCCFFFCLQALQLITRLKQYKILVCELRKQLTARLLDLTLGLIDRHSRAVPSAS
jgi:hypothetical protein